MKKIILVAGARPNFMKIAPVIRAIRGQDNISHILVHTGQHYDHNMSHSFFETLGIPEPNYNLDVGSGTHAEQTAKVMIEFEKVCIKEKPDTVVVVGDVNSTIAAGIVAKKLHITLAHIEAGLRSGDRTMPEEINRIATDAITDIFFTTEDQGTCNLYKEGHSKDKVFFVGHVMIDNLLYQLDKVTKGAPSDFVKDIKNKLPEKYICMTMHRPSNVDCKETLEEILTSLSEISKTTPVIFPCHPRTRKKIYDFGLENFIIENHKDMKKFWQGLFIFDPMDYNDFLYLWKDAVLMITDSGGLQEETTALKIPCVTIRKNTERPVTVEIGSNEIAGVSGEKIIGYAKKALINNWKESKIPPLWDGMASERIADVLSQ